MCARATPASRLLSASFGLKHLVARGVRPAGEALGVLHERFDPAEAVHGAGVREPRRKPTVVRELVGSPDLER